MVHPPGVQLSQEFEVLDAQALLDLLLDHLPAYFLMKDEQYRIVAANRQFLSLYPEEQRDDVIGTTTVEQFEEEQRRKFLEQDRLALEQGFTETTETLDFPNGERRVLLTRKVGIGGEDDKRYVVAIAADITELHAARAELIAQRDELERKNAELTEFAYRTSHDLRAPVVSASTLIEMGQEMIAAGDTEAAQEAFAKAHQALSQVNRLADDVVAIARIDQGVIDLEEVEPEELIERAMALLSTFAEVEGVSVEREYAHEGPVWTDVEQLSRAVENLVSNAIKYHDPDKADRRVAVSTRSTADGDFVFECRDNGLGVPAQYRDELFTMFRRFHPRVAFGSGLGLYTVKAGIEKAGGRLEYEDTGDGSCFRVVLPAGEAS